MATHKNIGEQLAGDKKYSVVVPGLKSRLGLSIKGNTKVKLDGGREATVYLPVVEGLLACLSGGVYHATRLGDGVWAYNRPDAFAEALSAPVPDKDIPTGITRNKLRMFSHEQAAGNNQYVGRATLTVVPALIVDALTNWQDNGDENAKAILVPYLKLQQALAAAGEMPVKGDSQTVVGWRKASKPTADMSAAVEAFTACAGAIAAYIEDKAGAASSTEDWNVMCINTVPPEFREGDADRCDLLTDPKGLAGFLKDREFPRPIEIVAEQAAAVLEAVPWWAKYMGISARLRPNNGGSFHMLLEGPPATGKSTAVMRAQDGIPTISMSFAAGADPAYAFGGLTRGLDGEWKATLGSLSVAWRAGTLRPLLAAIRRKHSIARTLEQYKGTEMAKLLEGLVARPDDLKLREDLEHLAQPFFKKEWAVVQAAYFESGAPELGTAVRVNIEEIFHSAANKDVQNALTLAMEDKRMLETSRGIDAAPMFGYNVQVVATGNPEPGNPLSDALCSRFGFTVFVPDPDETTEMYRIHNTITNARRAFGGEILVRPPDELSVVTSDFEPNRAQVAELPSSAIRAVVSLAQWTRTEVQEDRLARRIDPRATNQLALTAAYFVNEGMGMREALTEALEPLIGNVCSKDEMGNPNQSEIEALRQKAAEVFEKA